MPSGRTKADFETRTAAINLPSSARGFSIDQMRSDTQWLSREANVNELAALRIVILEWQQRPTSYLQTRWSEEELLSLQKATAGSGLGALAAFKSQTEGYLRVSEDDMSFDEEDPRHLRQMRLLYCEKTFVVRSVAILVGLIQPSNLQPFDGSHADSKSATYSWVQEVGKSVWKAPHQPRASDDGDDSGIERYCEVLRNRLEALSDPSKWPTIVTEDSELARSYTTSLLEEVVCVLRLILLRIKATSDFVRDEIVLSWFQLMDQSMFFADVNVALPGADGLATICQCLVSIITTSLLRLPKSLEYLRMNYIQPGRITYPNISAKPYLDNDDCVKLITGALLGAASQNLRHISPAILAWSIITQNLREAATIAAAERQAEGGSTHGTPSLERRASFRDSVARDSRPEALLGAIMDIVPEDDPIALMGNAAVNQLKVFDVLSSVTDTVSNDCDASVDTHVAICARLVYFDLLKESLPLINYGPDIIQAVLSVLSYESVPNYSLSQSHWPSEPAKRLLDDPQLMGPRFMEQVISRYPYELNPFLSCLGAVSKSIASLDEDGSRIVQLLDDMMSFTSVLPPKFDAYDLVQEEEMTNCIRLTAPLPIFVASRYRSAGLSTSNAQNSSGDDDDRNSIPPGTIGVVLRDSRPFVVCWQHPHSALEYLGSLLSTRTSNPAILDAGSNQAVDIETAADILTLTSALLESLACSADTSSAKHLLGRLSAGLTRNDDIIRVVLDMFEEELQAPADNTTIETSLLLLTNCTRFMKAILSVYPERIWSFLGRSALLAIGETNGALAAIVSASEVPLARFTLLRGCTSLFRGLVDDAVRRAVSRNASTPTKAVTRFEQQTASPGTTPGRMISGVLVAFIRLLSDALQSSPNWRFNDPAERFEINQSILASFNQVLQYAYSIADSDAPLQKPTAAFHQPAQTVLEIFLSPSELTLQPILDIFLSAVGETTNVSSDALQPGIHSQTTAALAFCCTIVNLSQMLGRHSERVMGQLFQVVPLLVRLFVSNPTYKTCTIELLSALVRGANGSSSKEPPSLLSHLAPASTKSFVAVLSQLDQPLSNPDVEIKLWAMLTSVISNKQQWLAICLLTGSTPRDRLRRGEKCNSTSVTRSLLSLALDHLSNLGNLSPRRAVAMLEFVSSAQNHWPWATTEIGAHKDFIQAVTAWLSEIVPNTRLSDIESATRTAFENQMAAYVADILATYLHNARQAGDTSLVKTIATKIQYLRDHAAVVNAYNHSLHKTLAKNFRSKFPDCDLEIFKRTTLNVAEYGRCFFYDLGLATEMLGYEPSWSRRNGQGFVDEVARVNVNLSIVDSQIGLLKSWKGLAVELGRSAWDDTQIQKDLAKVVASCLKANTESSMPTTMFENIHEIRADFAFVLMQQLVNSKSAEAEVGDLVYPAWDVVRTSGFDFEVITDARDAAYYRSLLQTLFLALQPHLHSSISQTSLRDSVTKQAANGSGPRPSSSLNALLLEIVTKVVTLNFRALCGNVHTDPSSVSASDFVLLTALLQSVLRIPPIFSSHQSLASIVADSGVIRYATSLYSWSESLSEPNSPDPIYGEVAILFLLSLSTIPLCAEQMAIEGLLSHLSTANLSNYFRRPGGAGPFTEPTRLHSIWTRGILPLCLNLLEAVGPPIAAEVTSFLNSFPEQLRRAETDLHNTPASLRHPHAGSMTLSMASETHSLALIATVVERLKLAGPAIGVNAAEIESLRYEGASVREEIEGLLRGRRGLKERLVPVGEREGKWARMKGDDQKGAEHLLEERIVGELTDAVTCLRR